MSVTTGYSNTEVHKSDETVSSDTVHYTLDDSSYFEESSLFSYLEEDIAEHYANLATSVIACFSAEFKMEARVKCLNKILYLLEQDKDELIKRKKDKRTCGEKAEKEHWERTFGGSKKVDSVEMTVKKCEWLAGKKKEEEETVKAEVAEHKKEEEEERVKQAEEAEHKKKEEEDRVKAETEAEAAELKKKEEEVAECKKIEEEDRVKAEVTEHKKKEEDRVKTEAEAAELKKKEEEVAECKKKEEEKRVKADVAEHKKKEEDRVKAEAAEHQKKEQDECITKDIEERRRQKEGR